MTVSKIDLDFDLVRDRNLESIRGRIASLFPGLRAEVEGLNEDALWELVECLQTCFRGDRMPDGGWYGELRYSLTDVGYSDRLAHLIASRRGEFRDLFEGD